MELSVISPITKYNFSIEWLEAHTSHGSFIIQPGHAPTFLILSPNTPIIFMLTNGTQQSIPIGYGILETTRTVITIIMHEMS